MNTLVLSVERDHVILVASKRLTSCTSQVLPPLLKYELPDTEIKGFPEYLTEAFENHRSFALKACPLVPCLIINNFWTDSKWLVLYCKMKGYMRPKRIQEGYKTSFYAQWLFKAW